MDFLQASPQELHALSPVTYTLVIAVTTLSLLVFLIKTLKDGQDQKTKQYWKLIPAPKRLWLIGNSHHLWSAKDRLQILTSWCLQYNPYFLLSLGTVRIVILTSPEAIQKLLASTNEGHLNKGTSYGLLTPFWMDGLVVSKAKKWIDRRRFMSRAFTLKSFLGYMSVYNKESKELVHELANIFENAEDLRKIGRPIDKLLWKSTLRVICETTLGTDIWDIEGIDKLTSTMSTCKQLCMLRILTPWLNIGWVWKLYHKRKELEEGAVMLENFTRKVIQMRIRKAEEENAMGDAEKDEFDSMRKKPFKNMVEEMLAAGFDDEALVEEAQTIISTGYETTSATIQFVLFLLALNPHHQDICRAEVDRLFQDATLCPDGNLTHESLSQLKHLDRCIHETLRLFPVAFMYYRKLEAPLVIDENLELPRGADVGVLAPGVHRNPAYFPNPELFDPDRFLPENSTNRSQYAYIPFSAGKRDCIGFKFGLLEIKIMVARIIHHFSVKTSDKMNDVAVTPELTLMPERGYNFILEKRKQHPFD